MHQNECDCMSAYFCYKNKNLNKTVWIKHKFIFLKKSFIGKSINCSKCIYKTCCGLLVEIYFGVFVNKQIKNNVKI